MTSTTKITAFAFFLFISLHTQAQTDPCLEQLLQQPGTWKQNKNPESTAPADLAVEKRSTRTVHDMLRVRYSPMGGELQYGEGFGKNSPHPYDYWFYSIGILEYYCANGKIEKNHEGNTSLYVSFNQFSSAALYDTTTDVQLIGYHTLQHGIPEEVKPGIWHFPVDRAGLGFGQFGKSDMWLLTYDGKLPWSWVTRKQFLVKRRRNLLGLMESSRNSTQETIDRIEKEKTYKQEEYKNDPAKYEKYLRVDYNPGIERYKKFLQDNDKPYLAAIADIDKQLQQPESFLAEKAIIKQDTHDNLKYLFTEAMDPMAQVPILPNPDYFKRAPRHVAQFIELEIIWNHKDPIAVKFHDGIALALDMDVLKSYIGTVPPAATTVAPGSKPTMPALPSKISTPQADLDGPTGSIQQPEVDVKPSNPPPTTGKSATPAKAATTVTAGIPATSQPQVQTAQAAPSAKATSASAATLYAPTGSAVTIQSDAKEISATVQKGKEPLYGSAPVNLPPATSKDGSRNLSIKKLPAGLKGTILGMTGGAARICVDYNYDLLTRSSDDKTTGTFYESMDPAVGGYNGEEGRYVAFVTLAVGIDGSNGKYRQIFWRDRNTGVTKMISRAPDGGPGDADSYAPFMSANGQRVVFESNATNLVKDDKNGMKDIFVWDATDGKIRIVSAGSNGQAADGNSYEATISGDGNFIAFTSAASNLAATPKGTSNQNVFLHDLTKGKTEMISISATARQGGEGSRASISFDGSRIAFYSQNDGLVPGDKNGLWDLFLWQRGEALLKRISQTADGKERDQGQESANRVVAPALSGNGRFVAFTTTATNMVPGDNNGMQDVFVYDVETGKIVIASNTDDGKPGNGDSPIEQGDRIAISHDGRFLAFSTKSTNLGVPAYNFVLHDMTTGKNTKITGETGSTCGKVVMSYSGSYVVFGIGAKLDTRFGSSGLFAAYTAEGPSRSCPQ